MDKSIHSAQYVKFLKSFREARKSKGLSQAELAERVGENQSFISKCERGERRLDIVELRTLCAAMNLTLHTFVLQFEKVLQRREKASGANPALKTNRILR